MEKRFYWLPVALAAFVIVVCSNGNPVRSQVINYKTAGQNFSPYIDGQDPNFKSQITEQQLRTRMQVVAPYTQWIRTFGTTDGLEKAGLVARSLGLKAAIGAWLGRDLAANEQQVTNLISICQAGQCDLAIVGSEVLLRGDLSEAQLIDYIKRVRQSVPANIPVTTADVYSQFLTHPNVIANIDLVMANFYPYWEGTRVDLAMGSLHARYGEVKAAAGGKQVFVSETGWPSAGDQIGAAVPSAQNASFYFLNFVSWARANDVQYFYFESFNESWKAKYEGPQGAHWGIWDKDANLKPGMQDVFDGKTIPDNWSSGVISCDPNSPKLKFTSVPLLGSFDNLFGQVCGIRPADFRIVVYIKVGNGWWVKPFALQPLTTILNDGTWSADITTGGNDQTATEIVAYLVPNGFSPPILLGSPTIPDTLAQNSIAKAEALRFPDPSRIPILISEENSPRAIALDSVLRLRDPFPANSPVLSGADTRTRVMIFAFNLELLPGENLSIITADAEDASHRVYPLTVEHVGKVPGFDWLNCLIVRLHDGIGDIGDVLVRVTARGIPSNRVRIGIGHNGGGLPDDPGAVPTPGRKPL